MFVPHMNDTGAVQPCEYYAAAAGTYKLGQLLKMEGGKLTAVTEASTKTVPYLCMGNKTVADGEILPVVRVSRNEIYETQLTADAAEAKPGSMLQISAGGEGVDAGATGTFEITAMEGTGKDAFVLGRFQ